MNTLTQQQRDVINNINRLTGDISEDTTPKTKTFYAAASIAASTIVAAHDMYNHGVNGANVTGLILGGILGASTGMANDLVAYVTDDPQLAKGVITIGVTAGITKLICMCGHKNNEDPSSLV